MRKMIVIVLGVVLVFASTGLARRKRMIIRPGLLTDEMLRRGYQWHPRCRYRRWRCWSYSRYNRVQDWIEFGFDCAHSALDIVERIREIRERRRGRDGDIIFVASNEVKEMSCSTSTPTSRPRPSYYAPVYPCRSVSPPPPFEIKNINRNIISIGGKVVEKKTEEKKTGMYNENKNQIVVKLPTKADTTPSPAPTTQPTPTQNNGKAGTRKMIMGCVFSAVGATLLTVLVFTGIRHFRHPKQQSKAPPQQPTTSDQSKTEQSSTQQESTKAQPSTEK